MPPFLSRSWILRLLGLVLVVAGALKAHQLATGPVAESSFWSSRAVLIVGVEFELLLGLWLVSGLYPRTGRVVALVTFTLFAVVNLASAAAGEASCGCFGAVAVNPWYVYSLLIWWPSRPCGGPRFARRNSMAVLGPCG